jgi:hypothetical protein
MIDNSKPLKKRPVIWRGYGNGDPRAMKIHTVHTWEIGGGRSSRCENGKVKWEENADREIEKER